MTNDPSGIADFSDAQVIEALRNGVALRKESGQDRHLSSIMPYWLFHNMTDADALSVVAFLRSLPPVAGTVVTGKADAAPVAPLLPSSYPDSSLAAGSADYAAAQRGKYLLSAVAQCVKCHSPATNGLPSGDFFSGVAPANSTTIFASNITPDVTGIGGWSAADVATALKAGTNKAGRMLCGSMPSGSKGYAGLSDADARAHRRLPHDHSRGEQTDCGPRPRTRLPLSGNAPLVCSTSPTSGARRRPRLHSGRRSASSASMAERGKAPGSSGKSAAADAGIAPG